MRKKIVQIFKSIMRFRLIRDTIRHYKLIMFFKNCEKLSDKDYLIKYGKIMLGYNMNLDNPQTFNEKINWYKLNYHNQLINRAVDKIKVKEYIIQKGLNDILIPTIAIYDNLDMISINSLTNEFVIKNTMDSGGVYICRDKKQFDINCVKKVLNNNIDKEFIDGKSKTRELAYDRTQNKIIVEELIKTSNGRTPWDYKFFCFNGEPKFLFVATDRDTNVCFDFYDIDFNWLDVRQGHPNSKNNIIKPKNYDKMIEVCRILSKDFPQVRVDLYNVEGKIYFGELTFYHFAGLTPFSPKKWDRKFGEYWDLKKNVTNVGD